MTTSEMEELFKFLKIDHEDPTTLTKLDAYAKGHLLLLNPSVYINMSTVPVDMLQVDSALKKIALASGVTANDL
jgi:hypothetical protein